MPTGDDARPAMLMAKPSWLVSEVSRLAHPLLAGRLAAAGVNGIGGNPDAPVEAVLKHYVANEQEFDRTLSSSNMDARVLRELYTLPFEIATKRSDAGGMMVHGFSGLLRIFTD